ncbi:MAG: hypothetical protein M1538_02790 [Candidatus Marsarchaeota archaeon]|nr:hypothetical protein [Candidatus Marsarchaeota archaeon]
MAMRVYECDESEVKELKKVLSYDPYLDNNLIPKVPELSNKDIAKMTPEQLKEYKDKEARAAESLKKLSEDKLANVIFVRQDYDLREGRALGIETSKSYLYLKATDEFLDLAEEKFKRDFKTIKRTDPEIEKKFIAIKEDEDSRANQGFGSIFG